MEVEYVTEIQKRLEEVACLIYSNRRVKHLTITVDTLMGNSISYISDGDPNSPECKVEVAKNERMKRQNAIQKYSGPTRPNPASPAPCAKNIHGGIQRWV